VTFEAAAADIGDILLGVLTLHFSLVMAFITIDIGGRAIMTAGTIAVGIPVVHGEIVAADIHIAPTVGVMALRTLAGPVIGRRIVAGLAVGLPGVVEAGVAPGVGVVTL